MDDQRFKGSYPGGPRRDDGGKLERAPGPPRVSSVGDIEERAQAAVQRNVKERRRRRVLLGFLMVVAVGGAVGLWMGFRSHRTPEEMVEELNRDARPDPISDEDLLRRELIRLQNESPATTTRQDRDQNRNGAPR